MSATIFAEEGELAGEGAPKGDPLPVGRFEGGPPPILEEALSFLGGVDPENGCGGVGLSMLIAFEAG